MQKTESTRNEQSDSGLFNQEHILNVDSSKPDIIWAEKNDMCLVHSILHILFSIRMRDLFGRKRRVTVKKQIVNDICS